MLYLLTILTLVSPFEDYLEQTCDEIGSLTIMPEYCFDIIFDKSESKLPKHEVKQVTWCESSWRTGVVNDKVDSTGFAQYYWESVKVIATRAGFVESDIYDPVRSIQLMPYIQRSSVYIYREQENNSNRPDYWQDYWDYVLGDDFSYLETTDKLIYWGRWDCRFEIYNVNRWELVNPRLLEPEWIQRQYIYDNLDTIGLTR